jgi:carbonic anhydrase
MERGVTSMNPTTAPAGPLQRLLRGASRLRFDLGLRALAPAWRRLLTTADLGADAIAGLTVACVAVPLSLAIAVASEVPPAVGLVTAVVAGVVCALFGGTPLAVSGPAAAMAVLVGQVVETHGVGGLLVVGLGAGALQILTGVFRLGRLVRYVPVGVVEGFTAGIGAIILIGQLPRALGLPPPDQSHVLSVITHVRDEFHQLRPVAVGLSGLALALCLVTPRFTKRVPGPLLAVLVPSLAVALFHLDAQTIGPIPRSLPPPHLPGFPTSNLGALGVSTIMVFALASLETLLSSTAVDKLAKGPRHDPDQELIGQGLGNVASSLFGGIPVTGVIARSALNVQAGARSRRSSIIHSAALLGAVFFAAPYLARIPMAALAGVLLSVALRMLDPAHLRALWRASRSEAAVYAVTFFVIVLGDLLLGVQAGLTLALLIAAVRLGRVEVEVTISRDADHAHVYLRGPVTFLSQEGMERVREELASVDGVRGVVLHAVGVTAMDVTGADLVAQLVAAAEARGAAVAILGLPVSFHELFTLADPSGRMPARMATVESDVSAILDPDARTRPIDRLLRGAQRFHRTHYDRHQAAYERLADEQHPHTLFITCCDSRVDPSLLTSSGPGELFVLRNIGNLVPRHGDDATPAEAAAIEFALQGLDVKEIVVCGHANCGAMKAVLSGVTDAMPAVSQWLKCVADLLPSLGGERDPTVAERANVQLQLEHLRTYPVVLEGLARGDVRVHGWHYDIRRGELQVLDEAARTWGPITVGEVAGGREAEGQPVSAAP